MDKVKILPHRGGYHICVDGFEVADIESSSFYMRNIRLKKDGRRIIQKHPLAASLFSNQVYAYNWAKNHSIEVSCGDTPTWLLKAQNKERNVETTSKLTVSSENGLIKYKVAQEISFIKDGEFRGLPENGGGPLYLEFTNPYPKMAVGPAYEMPDDTFWPGIYYPGGESYYKDWKKRWDLYAFENTPGIFYGWKPHHYYPLNIQNVSEGGMFAALDPDPDMNFVYKILKGDCKIGICWWGYDIHFWQTIPCEKHGIKHDDDPNLHWCLVDVKAGQKYKLEYEFYTPTKIEADKIRANTIVDDNNPKFLANLDRPIIKRFLNEFREGSTMGDPNSFAWNSSSKGATWDKTTGYDDNFSLKLDSDGSFIPSWGNRIGQEMFMYPLSGGKQYKLSAYIKTKNVIGTGARIKMGRFCILDKYMHHFPRPAEYYNSRSITGTCDWTKVDVIATIPENAISTDVIMELEGSGTAWIDNLLFEEL